MAEQGLEQFDRFLIQQLVKPVGLRDTYTPDLSDDQEKRIDRRLGIALAIGLDALQNR